jgi:hypothetical protein
LTTCIVSVPSFTQKAALLLTSAYILQDIEVDDTISEIAEGSLPYSLGLWNLSFDGDYVRRASRRMMIGSFDGERPIMGLNIIPAALVDAAD